MQLNLIYGKQNKCYLFGFVIVVVPQWLLAKTIGKYNGTRIIISHMELAKSLPGFGHKL